MLKYLKISGRVQGVGYRYFTLQNARELGVAGWVKNMRDGTVEVVLSGSEDQVAGMIDRLKKGPFSAKVTSIKELDTPQQEDDFQDFSIR